MMYHCMPMNSSIPRSALTAKCFQDVADTLLHAQVDDPQKHAKEKNRRNHYAGGRNNLFAARPGDLLHFHANVMQKLATTGDFVLYVLTDACCRSGDCVSRRIVILHFHRLRGHASRPSTSFIP